MPVISRLCRVRKSFVEAKNHRCYHTADGSLLEDRLSLRLSPKHDGGTGSALMCTEIKIRRAFAAKMRSRP